MVERVVRYVREVRNEAKKVIWPTRRQTLVFTGVVIVAVALMAGFMYGFDVLLNWLWSAFVGAPVAAV